MELIADSKLSGVYEYSIRILFILSAANQKMSIEKLSYLDFVLFNISEFYKLAENINSDRPFISSEWLVRIEPCDHAVRLLASKGLIDIEKKDLEILVGKSETTDMLISILKSRYFEALGRHTKKMTKYYNMDERELRSSFRLYMKKSGSL